MALVRHYLQLDRAAAEHLDLLAVDRRGARYLDAPLGPPVGIDREWTYRSATITLDDDVVLLSGWAPHESQQKPLPRGSAKTRLADVLGVKEMTGEEPD